MLFCQFANSQSVPDISNGLRSATGNLNYLGMLKSPSKSTLSYQNKHRSWELFRDYYYALLKSLGQQSYLNRTKCKIKSKIFLLDATTISLCLSFFDWAKYKTKKGAYDIPLLAGRVIVADRFYNDFSLLNVWDSKDVYFLIRHKNNIPFNTIKELELPENKHQHLSKDEIIELREGSFLKNMIL